MIKPYHRFLAVTLSAVMTVMPTVAFAAVGTPEADLNEAVAQAIVSQQEPESLEPVFSEQLPEEPVAEEPELPEVTEEPAAPLPEDGVYVVRNGEPMELKHYARIINQVTYVSVSDFFAAMGCNAWWDSAQSKVLVKRSEELEGELLLGSRLARFNGRCWYMTAPCLQVEGMAMLPLRDAAKVFNCTVTWEGETRTAYLEGYGLLQAGNAYYDQQDLLWIARIVRHESCNQPLDGKVGVANVILNRMNSPAFPNTAEEVIFDTRSGVQFVTRESTAILIEPCDECFLAAKLALEGYETAPDCLYFASNRVAKRCWAGRHRPTYGVIGGHTFFL